MSEYSNGVIERLDEKYKVTHLTPTVPVLPSLLNAPLFVLHPVSAKKIVELKCEWQVEEKGEIIYKTFRFERTGKTPFPLQIHAQYLDILLGMFTQNWNPKGILHFRYVDILSIVGKKTSSRGSRESIQETIKRYSKHKTEWCNSWRGRVDTIGFSIIKASSLLDIQGEIIKGNNPRNTKKKESWHTVVFDEQIVKALKEDKTRIFLTSLYTKLEADSYCVYRYLYGFPDAQYKTDTKTKEKVLYNLRDRWFSINDLRHVFHWTGRQARFLQWLKDRLSDLNNLGLLRTYRWNSNETAVNVLCENHKVVRENLKEKNGLTIVSENKESLNLEKCPDHELLALYYDYKAQNRIPEEECSAIDMLLTLKSMQKSALDIIRKTILSLHAVSDD